MGTYFTTYFEKYAKTSTAGQIDQNCLNMFNYDDVPAFILRIAILMMIFSSYPLLNSFLRNLTLILFFRKMKPEDVPKGTWFLINFTISFAPLMFALFYPSIGSILSYTGAFCGFSIIYVFPVMTYMKHKKTLIQNPLLAEAILMNEFNKAKTSDSREDIPLSPKIGISDKTLRRKSREVGGGLSKIDQEAAMKKYWI